MKQLLWIVLLGFTSLLISCQEKNEKEEQIPLVRIETQRPLMGTLFRIVTYARDPQQGRKVMEEALDLAQDFGDRATDYDPDSELNQLCAAPVGQPIKVNQELFDVLELSVELAQQTGGVFDPTLGPLTHLWRTMRRTGEKPTPEDLASARSRCGVHLLKLDREAQTVAMLQEKMQLDLGGIAKGFAADLIFDYLDKEGYSRTLVAAAGDIRVGDSPPEKEGWTIGLRTFHLTPTPTINLTHCAVSTSGDLFQKVMIGEQTFSHIIDPQTGLGLTTRRAASIIMPQAKYTDPLATAACLAEDPQSLFAKFEGLSMRVLYESDQRAPVVTGQFRELK